MTQIRGVSRSNSSRKIKLADTDLKKKANGKIAVRKVFVKPS